MGWILFTFAMVSAASFALTTGVRVFAAKWGIVDKPDGGRKKHRGEIPLWGGVAVYLAVLIGLLAASFGGYGINDQFGSLARAIAVAAGIVCCVGCIDDAFHLSAKTKLVLQICSILPMVLVGYSIDSVVAFGYRIDFGWLGIPITVVWLLGCINALNLIDGMDGLASLVGLSTAVMMAVIAANEGNPHVAVIALTLAGALAGFFVHNRPPAKIFLGDSGSMVIGLVLGVLGMQGSLKTSATLSITAPVVVMTLPMFDIVLAVVRRVLTGRRFDAPDREHIHHRLLDRGLSQWQVLCILGALCLTTGAAATAATIFRKDALAWITSLTLIVVMIRMKLIGYHEFDLVRRAISKRMSSLGKAWGRSINSMFFPRHEIVMPLSLVDSWNSLIGEIQPMGIRRLDLRLASGPIEAKRHWLGADEQSIPVCRWSVSVSVQTRDGRACELRADGLEKPHSQRSIDEMTSRMRSFGNHVFELVEDTEVLPLMDEVRIINRKQKLQDRKAA